MTSPSSPPTRPGPSRAAFATATAALLCTAAFLISGCDSTSAPSSETVSGDSTRPTPIYEDGTYRGGFFDRDEIQVVVQLTLADQRVTDARFRYLTYSGTDHLNAETDPAAGIGKQYQALLNSLIGEEIHTVLPKLYEPGERIAPEYDEVDGVSAATIRASKVISAIRDALNRGVYAY
ncbi:hypothetical protein CKO15_10130 [Halorhodospira abdelmalekii]|uniref:FMN-binding protein n=1 Tax=Halorhodospira abdelmalekii TaxID=421629 RepID=UPI00190462B9|nr:FMN-binding protein [Halorhodospira abdelmalekii]MBK1735634.1 hypothetical protein [Halorhodospira abdelmalekii]